MDIWNSIESLSLLAKILQGVAVFAAIVAAISGASTYFVNNRKTVLEAIEKEIDKRTIFSLKEKTKDLKELKQRNLDNISINIILKGLANTEGTKLLFITNDSKESQEYMSQFSVLFRKANWDIKHFSSPGDRYVHKMSIGRNEKLKQSRGYDALVKALNECGIEFDKADFGDDTDNKFDICFDVGTIEANPYQAILDRDDM